MKKKQKLLTLFLSASILVTALSGCGKGKEEDKERTTNKTVDNNVPSYMNATGFPIVKEPITLKAMVSRSPAQTSFADIMIWKEYEKMTGIKIEWDEVPNTAVTEKRNLALVSGDMPDMFFKNVISISDLVKFGNEGAVIKLNDLIDKYAPNFKQALSQQDDIRKSLPDYDGNIWSFCGITTTDAVLTGPKTFINKKWMDKLGLKMPETTDEFYNILKAFKEKDPNGNGKQDEIPMTGTALGNITIALKGSWGLGNAGRNHNYVDMGKDNKLRFIYTAPEYKSFLEYMNKLYKEGLLDQEIFTMNSTQLLAKGEKDSVGVYHFSNTQVIGATNQKDFIGIDKALKGPAGDQMYAARTSGLAGRGAVTITKTNKYPEATVRWVDYFFSDEGVKLYYMGIEGKTYHKTANGEYEFLPELTNNIPAGSTFDQVISKYVPYANGGNPTIVNDKYFKGGEMEPISKQAAKNMEKYVPKIWGTFVYTNEELEEMSSLENDLKSYVTTMEAKFIQGKEPLSNWDSYVESVKKIGVDKYLKIYDAAYQRYMKAK
jgi:putative aldouronate transport system substrate-binding protein